MKQPVLFALVAVLAVFDMAVAENAEWGVLRPADKLLIREIVHKDSKFLRVVTKDVDLKGHINFSYIKVTDQYKNNEGGYASLYAGGVGYDYVTLHLKSQRGHGFNFIIEIYG